MKKYLLSAFAALISASSFALDVNQVVNTPQGAFVIKENANCYTGSFAGATITGWNAVSATEGKTIEELFVAQNDGTYDYVSSQAACVLDAGTEGMSYTLPTSLSGDDYYVVSFKLKNAVDVAPAFPLSTSISHYGKPATNYVNLLNADNVSYVKPGEIVQDWTEFCVAVKGDAGATLYFQNMATTVQIADIQIKKAQEIYDMRKAQYFIDYGKALVENYDWENAKGGQPEIVDNIIAYLEVITGEGGEFDVNNIEACEAVIQEFKDEIAKLETGKDKKLDDILASDTKNYMREAAVGAKANYQKQGSWGIWKDAATRLKQRSADDDTVPQAWNTPAYGYGSQVNEAGVRGQFELEPGSYWFSLDGYMYGCITSYTRYAGLFAYSGEISVAPVAEDGTVGEPIACTEPFDWDPMTFERKFVAFQVTEKGKYQISVLGHDKYSTDENQLKFGGSFYMRDFNLYGILSGAYTQDELNYVANVQAQIKAAKDAKEAILGQIADETKFWGKAYLKEFIESDTIVARFDKYLAIENDVDAILATYDPEVYVGSDIKTEKGLLEYEVYNELAKYVIAEMNSFNTKNAVLESLIPAIENAETVYAARIYDTSTSKTALAKAIQDTKDLLAAMKASDYSEENEATIKQAIADLATAVENFKADVPAENITVLADIDFSNPAVLNEETETYSIAGDKGVMEFSIFSTTTSTSGPSTEPFEVGFEENGEVKCPGVLRIGTGTGTVNLGVEDYETNILKVSCDFYFGRLNNRNDNGYHVGFFLKDAEEKNVTGIYFSPYWNNTFDTGYNPCGLTINTDYMPSNTAGNAGFVTDGNKTHYEFVLDFGTKQMTASSLSSKASQITVPVALEGVPATFVVQSNYSQNDGRRCWFDNLKIEMVKAGAPDPTGIKNVNAANVVVPVKAVKDGQVFIKTAKGTFTAAGAKIK